ncbi:carbohydrate ABC transporter permease [Paenibacillaceae bacterium WGS1546]|uniref:carbohydrate ABC transporter permease n=1 Tax=Cohnella sp. WGS1546 TaxID=3366810 RepID=UPI00372D3656
MIRKNYPNWMLAPGLLIFLLLFVVPSAGSFYYAFTNWTGIGSFRWIGLDNFRTLLDTDDTLLALRNTFLFTIVTTLLKIGLGLALALFVNRKLKTAVYLRSVLFFPAILSGIAVALAFTAILHPDQGILNQTLRFLHLDGWANNWLTDRGIVMYAVSFVEVWKWAGFHMVLFLAGLQTIPGDMYESSTIDGASKAQQLRYITLPLIRPVLNANLLFSIIGGLKVFEIVYGLTGGGPGNASVVLNVLIFKSYAQGRLGEATAANLILFLLVTMLVLALNKLLGRREEEHA